MRPDEKRRARKLRREQTPAEKILWSILRDRRFVGFKFRRQQPIGPFYADFVCASLRLIIEVDGETHVGNEAYDASRTRWLEQNDYTVVRI